MIECRVKIRRGLGLRKNKFRLDFNLERLRENLIFNLGLEYVPERS